MTTAPWAQEAPGGAKLPPMPTPPSPDDSPAAPDIDEAGVDRAQIRAMLDRSPEERLQVAQEWLDSILSIRRLNEHRDR